MGLYRSGRDKEFFTDIAIALPLKQQGNDLPLPGRDNELLQELCGERIFTRGILSEDPLHEVAQGYSPPQETDKTRCNNVGPYSQYRGRHGKKHKGQDNQYDIKSRAEVEERYHDPEGYPGSGRSNPEQPIECNQAEVAIEKNGTDPA